MSGWQKHDRKIPGKGRMILPFFGHLCYNKFILKLGVMLCPAPAINPV
jgi:hypothetical protein